MSIEYLLGDLSREIANTIFPNTSQGRSLSRMTADYYGTNVETVHAVGLMIIVVGAILIKSRK